MKGTFRKSSIKTDDIKDKVMSYWNWERWNENIRVEVMRAIDLTIQEVSKSIFDDFQEFMDNNFDLDDYMSEVKQLKRLKKKWVKE